MKMSKNCAKTRGEKVANIPQVVAKKIEVRETPSPNVSIQD